MSPIVMRAGWLPQRSVGEAGTIKKKLQQQRLGLVVGPLNALLNALLELRDDLRE